MLFRRSIRLFGVRRQESVSIVSCRSQKKRRNHDLIPRSFGEGGSEALSRMLAVPEGLSDDDASLTGASAHADLTQRIVEMVRAEFPPRTWHAFWQSAVDGRPSADIAGELGIKVSAVYVAKSRVLAPLRQELVAGGRG
jgi:DNA-directed RNA polymerase specialized sigma24 family protein